MQRLLGELRKSKVLKVIKLVDILLKFKQSWMYVPQGRLSLLFFKEKYDCPGVGHRRRKNHHRVVSTRYHWPRIEENVTYFTNI